MTAPNALSANPSANRASVATLPVPAGQVLALRLTRVSDLLTTFRPSSEADLWSAIHRSGVTLSFRWIVFPARTIGAPGHVEIFVVAQLPTSADPDGTADELRTLLALAYPTHTFVPVTSGEELTYALAPFGDARWSLALARPTSEARAPVGFRAPETRSTASRRELKDLLQTAEAADPSQVLFLLASHGVASNLVLTVTPSPETLAERPSPEAPPVHLFQWQVVWSGSAGVEPRLLSPALTRALGVPQAVLEPVQRRDVERLLSGAANLQEEAAPSLFLAHGSIPSLLPTPDALASLVPGLRTSVRPRLPDTDLARAGGVLGATFDGRPVRLPVADRLRHLWILGQTGTGKSTLLLNRILADAEDGHGVALFDPHGELVEHLQRHLSPARRKDLIVSDVSAPDSEVAFNPLESTDVAGAHMRAGQMLQLICSLWPADMTGPVFQQAATHGLLLLAARFENPGTLAEFPRLFIDDDLRDEFLDDEKVAERVPESVQWFRKSWAKYTAQTRSESLDYYISKFNLFLTDPMLRRTLSHRRSTVNLRQLMDQRGLLLCNLSRGAGNPLATALLTGVYMQCTLNAALSRADLPAAKREPFFVYCDEFQRIAGPATGAILSEVRKYGVGLVLAHQFVDQIPEETLAAILGNVGTKIVFRIGAPDAHRMVAYQPELNVTELIRQPNFTALIELLNGGVPSAPFTLTTAPPPDMGSAANLSDDGLRFRR